MGKINGAYKAQVAAKKRLDNENLSLSGVCKQIRRGNFKEVNAFLKVTGMSKKQIAPAVIVENWLNGGESYTITEKELSRTYTRKGDQIIKIKKFYSLTEVFTVLRKTAEISENE